MYKYIRLILFLVISVGVMSIPINAQNKKEDISLKDVKFKEINIIPSSESIYSLMPDSDIAQLADKITSPENNIASYGFTDEEKTIHQKFFAIGTLYANLLAKLSGKYDKNTVIEMVKSMQDGLDSLGASNAIYVYLFNLENMISSETYQADVIKKFVTMLYPFIEEFAKSSNAQVSLQAGHWLVDLGVIAAAKNNTLAKQSETANYFADEYEKLDASKGIVKSLREIADITSKDKPSGDDFESIIALSDELRGFLK